MATATSTVRVKIDGFRRLAKLIETLIAELRASRTPCALPHYQCMRPHSDVWSQPCQIDISIPGTTGVVGYGKQFIP